MNGLVLEGGGGKGAYHIGAYKAIRELGIEVNGVAGTSVGALNGAMIVQHDFEKVYNLWENMTYERVINIKSHELDKIKNLDINSENLLYLMKRIKIILNNKGLDITPLRNLLEENIDEDKLRNSDMDFGIVTVSLSDMKPLRLYIDDIPKGRATEYLMASAYFPAFKLEKMDGKLFIDGGFYDNLPMGLLVEKGYDRLIAIRTHGIGRTRKINNKDIDITYIKPNESLGGTLDFSTENARKNLKLGYYDALKVFKSLKGNRYYIIPKNDEEYFMHYLLNLGEDKILRIGQILGIEGVPYRRALFEMILPRIADFVGAKENANYEDIIIMFYEELLKDSSLERFKTYDFDRFTDNVLNEYLPNKKSRVIKNIPKFIKQNDILSKAIKKDIISEVANVIFN